MLREIGSNIWEVIRLGLIEGRHVRVSRLYNGSTRIRTKSQIKQNHQTEFRDIETMLKKESNQCPSKDVA